MKCAECKWFYLGKVESGVAVFEGTEYKTETVLEFSECRRFPAWTPVSEEHYCGEFEKKE